MNRTDLEALDRAISRSFWLVSGTVLVVFVAYFIWFFAVHTRSLSADTDGWGQFGDYIGGLLNPLVAYSAFYWLTRSVRLQKEELLETRHALEESAASQAAHAASAQESVRVAAYTALINSAVVEVQSLRGQASSVLEQASRHQASSARLPNGEWANAEAVNSFVRDLDSRISYHSTQRVQYENALKVLLKVPLSAYPR